MVEDAISDARDNAKLNGVENLTYICDKVSPPTHVAIQHRAGALLGVACIATAKMTALHIINGHQGPA